MANSIDLCNNNQHCSDFIRRYLKYCLCNTRDGVSLFLGLASVFSWGVAEVPQIITNHTLKSTEGISPSFIATWILGDLFNLFGCMLEPATLPTQYYTALLYTLTSLVLFAQSIYFGRLYHPSLKPPSCTPPPPPSTKVVVMNSGEEDGEKGLPLSFPVPIADGKSYYSSARYLSRSYNAAPAFSPPSWKKGSGFGWMKVDEVQKEPLLTPTVVPSGVTTVMAKSAPVFSSRDLLCMTFLWTFLMGVSAGEGVEGGDGNGMIAGLLGWGMAAIYMLGRVPQIWLNVRRGSVKGLNPCMFVFALVGNITYVGSILVKSMEWRDLRPNMPWLVDAVGCVTLDSLILVQFFYYAAASCSSMEGGDERFLEEKE